MQASQGFDDLFSRPECQVISVPQEHFDADFARARRQSFDGPLRADRHERGRFQASMRRA